MALSIFTTHQTQLQTFSSLEELMPLLLKDIEISPDWIDIYQNEAFDKLKEFISKAEISVKTTTPVKRRHEDPAVAEKKMKRENIFSKFLESSTTLLSIKSPSSRKMNPATFTPKSAKKRRPVADVSENFENTQPLSPSSCAKQDLRLSFTPKKNKPHPSPRKTPKKAQKIKFELSNMIPSLEDLEDIF